jgi:hypothetical protein
MITSCTLYSLVFNPIKAYSPGEIYSEFFDKGISDLKSNNYQSVVNDKMVYLEILERRS